MLSTAPTLRASIKKTQAGLVRRAQAPTPAQPPHLRRAAELRAAAASLPFELSHLAADLHARAARIEAGGWFQF